MLLKLPSQLVIGICGWTHLALFKDDYRDKATQIDMMDEIYSNAAVTIAAGSGRRESNQFPQFILSHETPHPVEYGLRTKEVIVRIKVV
jgi:hypothetical protein